MDDSPLELEDCAYVITPSAKRRNEDLTPTQKKHRSKLSSRYQTKIKEENNNNVTSVKTDNQVSVFEPVTKDFSHTILHNTQQNGQHSKCHSPNGYSNTQDDQFKVDYKPQDVFNSSVDTKNFKLKVSTPLKPMVLLPRRFVHVTRTTRNGSCSTDSDKENKSSLVKANVNTSADSSLLVQSSEETDSIINDDFSSTQCDQIDCDNDSERTIPFCSNDYSVSYSTNDEDSSVISIPNINNKSVFVDDNDSRTDYSQSLLQDNINRTDYSQSLLQDNVNRTDCSQSLLQDNVNRTDCSQSLLQDNVNRTDCSQSLLQDNVNRTDCSQSLLQDNVNRTDCSQSLCNDVNRTDCSQSLLYNSIDRNFLEDNEKEDNQNRETTINNLKQTRLFNDIVKNTIKQSGHIKSTIEECCHYHIHFDNVDCDSMQVNPTKPIAGKQSLVTQKQLELECPSYKYIKDTPFAVDAFNYGTLNNVKAYFLTHFHYDHYSGLDSSWKKPLYCSCITANLASRHLGVEKQFLNILPLNTPTVILETEVTFLNANHCPGAVMILFKLKSGSVYLHVGDFRINEAMMKEPLLMTCLVDTLYLNVQYCHPSYDFPSQDTVIIDCLTIIKNHLLKNSNILIIVGSYSIGKEKLFKSIATSLNSSIWVSSYRKSYLDLIEDDALQTLLTSDKSQSLVHVLSMRKLHIEELRKYVNTLDRKPDTVIAFRPIGSKHKNKKYNQCFVKEDNIYLYDLPYSEQCNYKEIRQFVQFIIPNQIIPLHTMPRSSRFNSIRDLLNTIEPY